ncbi:hypothetical protein CONPUDRAFT_163621 [Coniophora puteana RWD-64-598 SS2]|uniref:F-box domain-containing protein n=1 Tax=Coniophora puteana (strain RWD-64-598) TaxID=741705 RepID=A0A5M3MZE5_CONPW|nr:uncharacterized protein CONPUDRAFT_163621 [Coniophora puteana RWD-64-598 SS2]EIW84520.1 hypothetical protein CONPUDRAFT_163621 [Coniophora puteana RWD-64-598 SS2]
MALQQLTDIIPIAVTEALRFTDSPYAIHTASNHNVYKEEFEPVVKAISDLSNVIHTVDDAISALMSCKAQLVKSRDGHSRLVSALWSIPVEIMADIFQLSLRPTVKRSDLDIGALQGRGSVFNVACVCRRWRDISLSTPRLWNVVKLSMPRELNPVAATDTVNLYEGDLEMLRRVAGIPSYLVVDREEKAPIPPSVHVHLDDASLAQCLEACWGLNISEAVFALQRTLFAKMTHLRRLKLSAYNKLSFDPTVYPCLTHLSLRLYSFDPLWFPAWIRSIRCDHITVLVLIYDLQPELGEPMDVNLKGMMQNLPRLTHLFVSAPYVEAQQHNVSVTHPALQSLGIITFDSSRIDAIQAILHNATLPALSELILQGDTLHEFNRNFFSSLLDFCARSQCRLGRVGVVSGWHTQRDAGYHMRRVVDTLQQAVPGVLVHLYSSENPINADLNERWYEPCQAVYVD